MRKNSFVDCNDAAYNLTCSGVKALMPWDFQHSVLTSFAQFLTVSLALFSNNNGGFYTE